MFKKKYFEGALTRFFSWPKTQLFGNHFHFIDENQNDSIYYQEKLPRSNNGFIKVLAVVLYPFFNPIAFVFRKIGTQFSAYQKVKMDIAEQDASLTNTKNAIKETAEKLAANAQSSTAIIKLFKQPEKDLLEEWRKLRVKVVDSDGFICSTPENKDKFIELFSLSCVSFLLMIKALEKIIEEENITTPEAFAFRFIDQHSKDGIAFDFNHAILRAFYSCLRANNNKLERSDYYNDDHEETMFWFKPEFKGGINTQSHKNAENFYIKGTQEYTWRKMYNFCIKALCSHSLYSAKAVHAADSRGDLSRAVDMSKKENYSPGVFSY